MVFLKCQDFQALIGQDKKDAKFFNQIFVKFITTNVVTRNSVQYIRT
jgi:hypothetical protein